MAEPETTDTCCEPTCCDDQGSTAAAAKKPEDVRQTVRDGYGRIARGEQASCCGPAAASDGTAGAAEFARAVGYDADELQALPEGANMGLSCGNPTALAGLRPGEVVLDLGAGAGFDVFVAAGKVGAEGRAIGVDMTADMVQRARVNAEAHRQRTGLDNVEFRLGEIENLPVADASVDVVISNCVINLSPDKPRVWQEIARVLRPGGRVAVSDIALLRPLPAQVQEMVEALVGCVAGAVLASDTRDMALDAGLVDVELASNPGSIAAMSEWHDPLYRQIVERLPADTSPADFVTSLSVEARKPDADRS